MSEELSPLQKKKQELERQKTIVEDVITGIAKSGADTGWIGLVKAILIVLIFSIGEGLIKSINDQLKDIAKELFEQEITDQLQPDNPPVLPLEPDNYKK